MTVEKGDGYDLNRSLFERLVTEGHPYRALSKQHRMRPEISALVRHLTYPDLTDGPGTESRPPIRGLQNTVIFIDHNHPEDDDSSLSDPKHLGATTSKKNKFEVDMIVKIVKYLKQQGYGLNEITVLTPYLGQLVMLREALETGNEIVFGEMDAEELQVAGLSELLKNFFLADQRKESLKIATIGEIPPPPKGASTDFQGNIDNYQGEENDIIVASLTRSNEEGNIGFMSSPERLNVLLSRARNGLIIIGNSETFLKSRSGKETWFKFFDMIKRLGCFYEGLPVRCEQHNDTKNVLRLSEDFEKLCPDGGCTEPWSVPFLVLPGSGNCLNPWLYSGATMSCGVHTCLRKCHRPQNHKDLTCAERTKVPLPCGHSISRGCNQSKASLSDTCFACNLARRKAEVDAAADGDGAGTNDRRSTSVDPQPPASPTSTTSPWRVRQTATTGNNRSWRSGQPTDHSTTVFNKYRGPRQSTDTYTDGLFSRPKPQPDSSYASQEGSDRKGSWRPTNSRW